MVTTTLLSAPGGIPGARDDSDLARSTVRRVSGQLLPLLFALFVCNYIDRFNVGIAALQMNRDLGLSASAYGLGAGIFFLGYALFEVPSNLMLARVGARRWIARIVISWGLIAALTALVRTPLQFYALRVLLGIAEAGFFPGIVYYVGLWFPGAERGRALSRFIAAIPVAAMIGNPLGAAILGLDGALGLRGWQWVFVAEGIPSALLGLVVLRLLTDRPAEAQWLSEEQRAWLVARLAREEDQSAAPHGLPPLAVLGHPMVWLLAAIYLLRLTTGYTYIAWAPLVIRDTLHGSALATGLVTGGIGCVTLAAILLVGASSDRTGERCGHAAACIAVAALGCVGAALFPNPVARVASLALVDVGSQSFGVAFWCLPVMFLRGSAAAAGIALINAFGNLGGFVGPAVAGWSQDATGSTRGAFLGLAVPAILAAVLCLGLRRTVALRAPPAPTPGGVASVAPRAPIPATDAPL
jgi:ACS family tartrate transporter-like MFS transporter